MRCNTSGSSPSISTSVSGSIIRPVVMSIGSPLPGRHSVGVEFSLGLVLLSLMEREFVSGPPPLALEEPVAPSPGPRLTGGGGGASFGGGGASGVSVLGGGGEPLPPPAPDGVVWPSPPFGSGGADDGAVPPSALPP